MSSDLAVGIALGLSGGIGIGSLILAAYHDYTMQGIARAEEEWELDRDNLELATTFAPDSLDHRNPAVVRAEKLVRQMADRGDTVYVYAENNSGTEEGSTE